MGYASKVRGSAGGPAVLDAPPIAAPAEVRNFTDRVWSDQQNDIFGWFKTSKVAKRLTQNLVVVARAGTGKTTTIVEGISHAPEDSIIMAAFNKRIAEELGARLTNPNAEAKTLHSIGFMLVREYVSGVRIAKRDSDRMYALVNKVQPNLPDTIARLVAKLHTKGREITPFVTKAEELLPLAEQFECDPEPFWYHQGFGLQFICETALACMQLAKMDTKVIDFADMIYLPLVNNWAMPRYNLGVVDEAQDMTFAQLELFKRVVDPIQGRICVVGDDRQAIYGFRGADSGSIDRLRTELDALVLKLTTTYRCGQVIVRLAQNEVPDIEAGPDNSEGIVRTLAADKLVDEAQPGDFILSRLNAPLAGYAMQLLRSGKRAQIAGRDIGAGLKALVRKQAKNTQDVDVFMENVNVWREKEVKRLKTLKFDTRAAMVEDQAETLYHLSEGAQTVRDIENVIDRLFTDIEGADNRFITLSSVHKAKGLEADRVFMLNWTFRRGKQEEDNIWYVAVTRARHELIHVEQGR